jgi:hypothetical protein
LENWRGALAMTKCECSFLRKSGGFSSFPDYDEYKERVISSGLFVGIPVEQFYGGIGGLDEHWFKCKKCGQAWRLVEPDPPFKGMWSEITDSKKG